MAGAQCDMARSFGSLLGSFGAFGLEPRRVGSPTRHGGGPIRRGALFRLTFGLFCHLGGGATSCWRSNVTWRAPNTTWRTLLTRFLGDLVPLGWSHVALEVQRDVVGGTMRRGARFWLAFGLFWHLWGGATSCWRFNATWRGPNATWPSSNAAWQGAIQCDAPFSRPSNAKKPPPN